MQHDQETPVMLTNVSSSGFVVHFKNNFVVLDDAEHVIGVDKEDPSKLILENVENGSILDLGGLKSFDFSILILVYDEESGSMYSGDLNGHIIKHKVDTFNQIRKKVKYYGHLGIGSIYSSARFMQFVFFGGNKGKIGVLDLSTGKLIPMDIETSIKDIYSLQVCVKSCNEIYLAVSGEYPDYSQDKTDLFDLSGLLGNDPIILRKFASEYLNNETSLNQNRSIMSKSYMIRKLTRERDEYKAKFNKMESKYNDLKVKYDNVLKEKEKMVKTYNAFKKETEIKTRHFVKKIKIIYNHKSTRTTIGDYNLVDRNGLFDETDPLVIIRDLKEDLKDANHENRQLQNSMYNAIRQRREAEEESRVLHIEFDTLGNNLDTVKEVVRQR